MAQDSPQEFPDDRRAVLPEVTPDTPPEEMTLMDLKGARARRGFPEWQPKGRKPGEDTTGKGAPAQPSRRSTGAGPT